MRTFGIIIASLGVLPAAAAMPSGIWSGFVGHFGKPKAGEVRLNQDLIGLFLPSGEFRWFSSDGSQVAGILVPDAQNAGRFKGQATYFPPAGEALPSACSLHDVAFEPGKWLLASFRHGAQARIIALHWDKDNEAADGKVFPAGCYRSEGRNQDLPDDLTLAADGTFTLKRAHGSVKGRLTQAKGNVFRFEAQEDAAAAAPVQLKGLACLVKDGVLVLAGDGKHAFTGTFEKAGPDAKAK